jgi:hypothetical protein
MDGGEEHTPQCRPRHRREGARLWTWRIAELDEAARGELNGGEKPMPRCRPWHYWFVYLREIELEEATRGELPGFLKAKNHRRWLLLLKKQHDFDQLRGVVGA